MEGVVFVDLGPFHIWFINYMRVLQDDIIAAKMNISQAKDVFAEMFPPAYLFSEKMQSPPYMYGKIRDFLDAMVLVLRSMYLVALL